MTPESFVKETLSALDGLVQGLRTQIETEPPKPSIGDYVRLVQMRLELGTEHAPPDNRPVQARWVDDESTPIPDPDPNVPWPGDESLK